MSNEDNEQMLRFLKAIKTREDSVEVGKDRMAKLSLVIAIIPTLILIATMIYNSGAQRQETDSKIDTKMLELRSEYIKELSDHKEKDNESVRQILESINEVRRKQSVLVESLDNIHNTVGTLDKRLDKQESRIERNSDIISDLK